MTALEHPNFPNPAAHRSGWPWENLIIKETRISKPEENRLKISIITPSFNQGHFIEETIRSILLQDYPNFEYILIDGGSTDQTLQIIDKYKPWITHWLSEKDEGQADAIKKGFHIATGEIIAWLNSDDYYEQNTLHRINQFFLSNPDVDFVNGDVNVVDEKSQFVRRIYAMRPSKFFAANYGKHGWPQQGCFWRRSAYDQAGGIDPHFKFCMDKDLFIRLNTVGRGKRLTGVPLANFRIHKSAKSATILSTADEETVAIINKYGQKKWSSHTTLMGFLWWLYRKQAALRKWLFHYFSLEI